MTTSIDNMYAFIATDETGEGITAFLGPQGWMPMVGADEERVNSLRDVAQQTADASQKRIVLAKFSVREDLEVIEPNAVVPPGVVIYEPGSRL